jgi:flagellar biosynthesis protein FlhB
VADEDDDKEDKTEDATPRRREEAREQGQVPLSQELVVAASLGISTAIVVLAGGMIASRMGASVVTAATTLGTLGRDEIDAKGYAALFSSALAPYLVPIACTVIPLLAIALLAGYAQVGFQMTPKALEWDIAKLNPTKGFGRIFSLRSVVRTSSALVKMVIVTIVTAVMTWKQIPKIVEVTGSEVGPMLAAIGHVLLTSVLASLIAILAIAAFDLFYQRWQHEKDLRMTKKQITEEHRSTEGDPQLKARIRRMQRETAKRRMMDDVPKATVVITNPTHYAVALRYERDEASGAARRAPWVVAKGVDHVAQKIKTVAKEHEILCYEDVPLARALHAKVEIGDEIPEAFYQAVASVLAYAYRLREGRTSASLQGADA